MGWAESPAAQPATATANDHTEPNQTLNTITRSRRGCPPRLRSARADAVASTPTRPSESVCWAGLSGADGCGVASGRREET